MKFLSFTKFLRERSIVYLRYLHYYVVHFTMGKLVSYYHLDYLNSTDRTTSVDIRFASWIFGSNDSVQYILCEYLRIVPLAC